eukprot:3389549-Rhodomonas_salina.1
MCDRAVRVDQHSIARPRKDTGSAAAVPSCARDRGSVARCHHVIASALHVIASALHVIASAMHVIPRVLVAGDEGDVGPDHDVDHDGGRDLGPQRTLGL